MEWEINKEVLPLTLGRPESNTTLGHGDFIVNERLELEAGPQFPNVKFFVKYNCYENAIYIIFHS